MSASVAKKDDGKTQSTGDNGKSFAKEFGEVDLMLTRKVLVDDMDAHFDRSRCLKRCLQALKLLEDESGVSAHLTLQVLKEALASYPGRHRSGTSLHDWARARLAAFVMSYRRVPVPYVRDKGRYMRWVGRETDDIQIGDMEAFLHDVNCHTKDYYVKGRTVGVANRLSHPDYDSYVLTKKMMLGKVVVPYRLKSGKVRYFAPNMTPKEMLSAGVFGGRYLNDCMTEFPREWYRDALDKQKLSVSGYEVTLNKYKKACSMSLKKWKDSGMILYPDERGWFQWYCRFYIGRRIPDLDLRQMKKWRSFVSRHTHRGRKTSQALLHWGFDRNGT